jgi:hypothetical protein
MKVVVVVTDECERSAIQVVTARVTVTVNGACNSFATRSHVAKEMQAHDGNAISFVGIVKRT